MLGQVIHGYRVDREMAVDKGGMGDVYFATHVESGAEAVVKVLKPEMSAHRDIVTRFFNEARAAASIHHPGIVQIHNVGYHGDRAYLLMEKLRGDDLETRVKSGPLPLNRAILFMRQTAGAIAAAHERGIVHRDLKPANLFIVRDPDVMGGERVKVLDFGIAKLSLDAGSGKTQGVFGTPAYMSPEQCASSGEVDARSDLYSLGCIFYELVCGRPPFGQGGIELIASHLRDIPPPPRALAPWVPPAVEAVILQLLEKNPAQRFATCSALIGALDGVAATLPPGATPSLPPQLGPSSHAPSYPPAHGYSHAPPSTLSGAAGALGTAPPPTTSVRGGGNRGLILGLAGVAVVGIAVIAVVLATGGKKDDEGGVAAAGAADAATAEPPPPAPAIDAGVAPPLPAGDAKAAAQALNNQGKVALFDKRLDAAIDAFSRAAVLAPTPQIFFNLGVAHYQAGHCAEARLALQQTVGDAASDAALKDKAKKMLERVGDCAPAPTPAGHSGTKPPKAVDAGVPVAVEHPTPPPPPPKTVDAGTTPAPTEEPPPPSGDSAQAEAFNEEGKTAMFASNFPAAIAAFKKAVTLRPEPRYFFNLGVAYYQTGQCKQAIAALQRVIQSRAPEALKDKARAVETKAQACAS